MGGKAKSTAMVASLDHQLSAARALEKSGHIRSDCGDWFCR